MALVVGDNSYITVAEADAYVQENYLSSSTEYQQWQALSEEDKEVLLRRGASLIDGLPLRGIKASKDQKMAFPRILPPHLDRFDGCFALHPTEKDLVVPQEVKDSQALQAMDFLSSAETLDVATRARLARQGVKSFKIGDLSETLDGGSSAATYLYTTQEVALGVSQKLNAWLGGGYEVCRYYPHI